jgi:hypothetical protein
MSREAGDQSRHLDVPTGLLSRAQASEESWTEKSNLSISESLYGSDSRDAGGAVQTVLPVMQFPRQYDTHFDRERLYSAAWRLPLATLATAYGMSEDTLRKACKKLQIPLPSVGYWQKYKAKRPLPERPPLPKL